MAARGYSLTSYGAMATETPQKETTETTEPLKLTGKMVKVTASRPFPDTLFGGTGAGRVEIGETVEVDEAYVDGIVTPNRKGVAFGTKAK